MKGRGFRLKSLNWAPLVLALLLALQASLAYTYLQERQEKAPLEQDLTKVERTLRQEGPLANPARSGELEKELKAAQATQAAARSFFPSAGLGSNSILDSVLGWAVESGVDVLNAEAPPLGGEVVQGHTYQAWAFSLKIAGEYGQVLDFLARLETGPLKGLIVRSVDISQRDASFMASVEFQVYGEVAEEATPAKSAAPAPEKGG